MMLLDIQKKGKESYINNIKTSIWFKCINIKPKPNPVRKYRDYMYDMSQRDCLSPAKTQKHLKNDYLCL